MAAAMYGVMLPLTVVRFLAYIMSSMTPTDERSEGVLVRRDEVGCDGGNQRGDGLRDDDREIVCTWFMPSEDAASYCPTGDGLDARPEDLGKVCGRVEPP